MRVPLRPHKLREFLPHQKTAFAYAKDRRLIALFMAMRLGKTLVAIRWAIHRGCRRILVLAPVTVLESWECELTQERELFTTVHGLRKPTREEEAAVPFALEGEQRMWVLMNYEALRSSKFIRYYPWDAVILDESIVIKNPQAKITKLCCDGFKHVRHRAILTGLPTPEGELDLYEQMRFLMGQFLGFRNFWGFRNRLFTPPVSVQDAREAGVAPTWTWDPKKGTREKIKQETHKLAYVLRREDVKIGSQKVYEVERVNMSDAQRKLYQQVEDEFAATLTTGETLETIWGLVQKLWCAKIAGGFDPNNNILRGAKADRLVGLLKGELRNEQVVVWFRFRHELEFVAAKLFQEQIPHCSVMGGFARERRKEELQRLRDGHARVALLTEKVAQFGVDLSVASTAIYYSNEYSCNVRAQSEDRILHPQKQTPLLYIDLVTRGTVDEDAVHTVKQKMLSSAAFMTVFMDHFRARRAR